MKKTMRKIVPALAMLLVSASMLSTASYAWFSMNKKVSASGMQVNVAAPSDIKISAMNASWAGASSTVDLSDQNLEPEAEPQLSHASSENGAANAFFIADPGNVGLIYQVDATNKAKYKDGSSKEITGLYGAKAVAYKDYTFYIANTTTRALNMTLDTSATEITSTTNKDLLPAMRFAILLDEGATVPSAGNVWCGANNERVSEPVKSISGHTATLGKVNKFVKETTLFELEAAEKSGAPSDSASKGVKKITVRVWCEGTDPACISGNSKTNKNNFEISIGFKDVTGSKVNVDASAVSDLYLEQKDGTFSNVALEAGFDSSNSLVQASSKDGSEFYIDNKQLKGQANAFYKVLSANTYDSDGSSGNEIGTLDKQVVYVDYKFTVKNNSAGALSFKLDLVNTKVTANNTTLSGQLRMAILINDMNKGIINGTGSPITDVSGSTDSPSNYNDSIITLNEKDDMFTFTVRVWVENPEDTEGGTAGQFNIVDLTNETINLNIKFAAHP